MKRVFLFCLAASSVLGQFGGEVHDGTLIIQEEIQHTDVLAQWSQQIGQATQAVNKLNDVVSNLNDVQGLIGKGMDSIGIDPSITSSIDLAKSLNNFGQAITDVQHNAGNVSIDLDKIRQATSDPYAWTRYATTSKSYDATQKAQHTYDDQMKALDQQRAKAEAQLKAANSLGAAEKAQAALDSVDAAQRALAEERRRAFEQQQANWIENQNQKDAFDQASRDWTQEEWKQVGSGLGDVIGNSPALKK